MTDWATFASALADDLPKLDDGDTVIIEYGQPYVQFAQAESVLYADTRGGDEASLAALGWRAPEPARGTPNWWTDVPWPLSAQDCRRLVDLMLATLRDVYGAPQPDALAYQAFNSGTGADLELPSLASAARIRK
jgi:hypothetical protein